MRIRTPVLLLFALTCALAAFLGLGKTDFIPSGHDKAAHAVVFFVLTTFFYWSIDTIRRRAVIITFNVSCLAGSFGSEVIQHFATGGERKFDIFDVVANIVGSVLSIALSYAYHGRFLARRKQQRLDRIRQDVESAEEHELSEEIGDHARE